jgi:hypothetical protein|nr:DUF2339 domain-containing protein [Kofleriaceae bacterium]
MQLQAQESSPERLHAREARSGLRWTNRLGVVALIIGFALGYATATENGWIGPPGQLATGLVAAALALIAGEVLVRRDHAPVGHGLTGLGVALLYLTAWASEALFGLVSTDDSFAMMIVVTGVSAILSRRYASEAIAVLAIIGGIVAPLVMNIGADHAATFVSYLVIATGGALVIARRRHWMTLAHVAGLGAVVAYGWWLVVGFGHAEDDVATIGAFALYAELALVSRSRWLSRAAQLAAPFAIVAIWKACSVTAPCMLALAASELIAAWWQSRPLEFICVLTGTTVAAVLAAVLTGSRPGPAQLSDVLCGSIGYLMFTGYAAWPRTDTHPIERSPVILSSAIAFAMLVTGSLYVGQRSWMCVIAVVAAMVNVGLARATRSAPSERFGAPRSVALALALAWISAVALLALSGYSLVIAWSLEALGVSWLSSRYRSEQLATCALVGFGIVLAAIAFAASTDLGAIPFFNLRFASCVISAIAMTVAASSWFANRDMAKLARIGGHVVGLFAIACEIAALAGCREVAAASIAASVAGLVVGAWTLVSGLHRRSHERVIGLSLLSMVIVKLVEIDILILARPMIVALALFAGAVLVAMSYVYSRRARVSRARTPAS